MAIWQFRISLVPRLGILRAHGHLPQELDEFKPPFADEDVSDLQYPDYWAGIPRLDSSMRSIESIWPSMDSWDPELRAYGYDGGNQIEVWPDDIQFKIDMRAFDESYLERIIALAKEMDCLVVLHENGRVLEAEYSRILEACEQSRASSFVRAPRKTLKKAKEEEEPPPMSGSTPH